MAEATLQQRISRLCTDLENAQGQLLSMARELDSLRRQIGMAPHFEDGDTEDDTEEEETRIVVTGEPYAKNAKKTPIGVKTKKSPILYLRPSPVKSHGIYKWWTVDMQNARTFSTKSDADDLCDTFDEAQDDEASEMWEGIRKVNALEI